MGSGSGEFIPYLGRYTRSGSWDGVFWSFLIGADSEPTMYRCNI